MRCASCGHVLSGSKICPSCGFDHREMKTPPVVYEPETVSVTSAEKQPAKSPSAPLGSKLKLYLVAFLLVDLWLLLAEVFRGFDTYVSTFGSSEIDLSVKALVAMDVGICFAAVLFAIFLVVWFFESATWAILLHAVYSAVASFLLLVSAFPYLSVSFFDRGYIGIAIMVLAFFRVYLWIVLVDREKGVLPV